MRAMKCWKRLTAFLLSFVMVLGLVLTNGITSEAARKETAWTEDGEIEVTVPSVMYKTHVQSFGWQNWKLNGDCSGTFGKSKRLEGIQILLVPKGAAAPASNYGGMIQNNPNTFIAR